MNAAIVVLILILGHSVLALLLLSIRRSMAVFYGFFLPSFLLAWIGYFFYEAVYIPANCTGECNIRVDLLLIYPFLAFVTICAIAYFVMAKRARASAKE